MRPAILNPLFADVTVLEAVGPKIGALLGRLVGTGDEPPRVIDLLFHLPVAVIDRSRRRLIAEAPNKAIVTLKVRVDRHQPGPPRNSRVPYRIFVHDDSGELALVYFHANRSWLERTASGSIAIGAAPLELIATTWPSGARTSAKRSPPTPHMWG